MVAVLLVGVGGSWSAGNIGPVVADVSQDFDITLTSVGLLSGAIYFSACVLGLLLAPRLAERLGLIKSLSLAAAFGGLGSAAFALAPDFGLAAVGRIFSGVGLGFAAGLGPVLARITGGVGRVGVFGAGFQLGIALGLGVGSLLIDTGVEWRVTVAVTVGVCFAAIPFLLAEEVPVQRRAHSEGFYPLALRSPNAWRLALLFMAMFTVPLTLGAWFVHYVVVDGGIGASEAGLYAFALFALSAVGRQIGGTLAKHGVRPMLLTGLAPLLAAVGLLAIGFEVDSPVVAASVVLMAAGFALPYAMMMIEAQRLWPEEASRPTSALTMISNVLAIPTVPILGALLSDGDGKIGFIALALIVLAAALVNLRPAGFPLRGEAPEPTG